MSEAAASPGFARRLTLFDATMIVISGIIGSGIFINPYVVAQKVHTPFLILAVWLVGGLLALFEWTGPARKARGTRTTAIASLHTFAMALLPPSAF